ncbi:hypothetical protein HMPREF9080_01864 [Cardiobacterium valvarum F0432]|uniref:Uncharacterized protein n=1 Tax=Cardiobacterium valvarum F0432 TaxID=797473 RepID=G9ZGG0_9GAMM|nr:hypothetical protein HMPREF9080_01864 [Cardiobacterium valvarum F0432]
MQRKRLKERLKPAIAPPDETSTHAISVSGIFLTHTKWRPCYLPSILPTCMTAASRPCITPRGYRRLHALSADIAT